MERIFNETIILEVSNVINDINASSNVGLQHRGHVVGLALLCATDALASYAYSNIRAIGKRYIEFINNHFPPAYQPFANDIYKLYRNNLVHSWNLFEGTMLPSNENIENTSGTISFGLLNFFDALKSALTDFLDKLKTDTSFQANVLKRYKKLKSSAR